MIPILSLFFPLGCSLLLCVTFQTHCFSTAAGVLSELKNERGRRIEDIKKRSKQSILALDVVLGTGK